MRRGRARAQPPVRRQGMHAGAGFADSCYIPAASCFCQSWNGVSDAGDGVAGDPSAMVSATSHCGRVLRRAAVASQSATPSPETGYHERARPHTLPWRRWTLPSPGKSRTSEAAACRTSSSRGSRGMCSTGVRSRGARGADRSALHRTPQSALGPRRTGMRVQVFDEALGKDQLLVRRVHVRDAVQPARVQPGRAELLEAVLACRPSRSRRWRAGRGACEHHTNAAACNTDATYSAR